MFPWLKNHPFAVEAFFESSLVLTFAIPKNELLPLIPECLQLDIFNDQWAFIAVAMVQTKGLRPKGFPKLLGNDFFLIGYRIFVKYYSNVGQRLRGLYIIKSETDKKKMEFFGNVFTHYNYATTDIQRQHRSDIITIQSIQSDFNLTVETHHTDIALPQHSPFTDWKEARRFAGPLPFTFTYQSETKSVLIIEGVRQNWIPKPVYVREYHFSFLDLLGFKDIRLANAFLINDIPYYWKKGGTEQWSK
ncbi:DUF2071 domain-containing protein [Parapedobacter tibetensis]|uniref:DUF2071 domain-containing protein n=1 Tax=Parapedobacter tibetensis TaxID=2972951 RepID=UPI00214D4EC1|nr:DUF2071 domain-containing protein [Parapedobacter tibetensis]